jgi:hypothetical protein
MIKKMSLLLIFLFTLNLFSDENPYSKMEFNFKNSIILRTGGEIDFEVKVNLPQKHYLYLSHATADGIGIITTFSFPQDIGFQLVETKRPQGIKKMDEMVLKDNGVFAFKIFELGTKKPGSNTKIPLSIRTQVCEEKENGICYPPKTISKELVIEIREDKKTIGHRALDTIPWESSFASAIAKAKSSNLNIYAIITEPSWCGACRYMDKEAFAKPEVQKVLTEKFIPWKVKDNEYGKVPTGSGSFGIPMFFVLDNAGKSLGKWSGGRDAKGLLPLLKPFEKASADPEPNPIKPPAPPAEDATELEIKSSDGSKCVLTYGKDYIWMAKKSGDFHNNGTFRFGVNNQEIKVKQSTRDLAGRKAFPVKLTTNGFRIEKADLKEFWACECKGSLLQGKVEGSDIEFTIEK